MARFIFSSRVIPERYPIAIANPVGHARTQVEFGISYVAKTTFHAGQALSILEVTEPEPKLLELRNALEADLASIVDLIGFANASAWSVDVVSVVVPSGETWVFGIQIPAMAPNSEEAVRAAEKFVLQSLEATSKSPELRIALADFREAIGKPWQTGFYCYRAIEAIVHRFSNPHQRKTNADSWKTMRERLRLTRKYIEGVKEHADRPRHGGTYSMTDEKRGVAFERSAEIIRRFVHYLKNEPNPLCSDEYPEI